MSQESVELAYRAADALSRGDLDAFLSFCDPDVEFHSRLVELEGGEPYRGFDGIRSWWKNVQTVWSDLSSEVEEIREVGDVLVGRVRIRGQGMESDAPWEQTQWHVTEWRNGRAIRWRACASEAEALDAAGLSE